MKLDLNCDLGEGYNDEAIMPYLSSCNIACGGHVGDIFSIERTVELAIQNNLAIGAHPSYPDVENFGRKSINISRDELLHSLDQQIEIVLKACIIRGQALHHIKPHGALYNDMAKDKKLSHQILKWIQQHFSGVKIYALAASETTSVAKELGMNFFSEVFADRRYESKHQLRDRSHTDAVIHDLDKLKAQLDDFLKGSVTDIHGRRHTINVDTICLHSDSTNAVALARTIYLYLKAKDVSITAD